MEMAVLVVSLGKLAVARVPALSRLECDTTEAVGADRQPRLP